MSAPDLPTPLALPLSETDLAAINAHLRPLTPEEILRWALDHLPGLHQTTAFGLTGLVAIDMLAKLTPAPPPLIFLDTLHHFPETYALVEEVKARYGVPVAVYTPEGCATVAEFEARFGERLWETDEERYDFVVKVRAAPAPAACARSHEDHHRTQVEPARRAYDALGVQSVITGRRASQGGARATLQPLEVDATGLLKLNPLFAWPFPLVDWYVRTHGVPRNALLDRGYRSVGDWHSTAPSGAGDAGERAGRWAGKEEKTECGLHVDYFAVKAKALKDQEQQASPPSSACCVSLDGIGAHATPVSSSQGAAAASDGASSRETKA